MLDIADGDGGTLYSAHGALLPVGLHLLSRVEDRGSDGREKNKREEDAQACFFLFRFLHKLSPSGQICCLFTSSAKKPCFCMSSS